METVLKSSLTELISTSLMEVEEPPGFLITEPPRILIVEDDPHMAELIATLLQSNWFNCEIRRSGAQGIQAFTRDPVDLIITDLRMAAGDGISLIEAIRRTSQAPVIIVTGFAGDYTDRVRFLDNVALLGKPFERQVLLDLVERALDCGNGGSREGWNAPPERD